jgi:hypothetical protein
MESDQMISKPQAKAIGDALLVGPLDEQRKACEKLDRQQSPKPAMGPIPAMVRVVVALFGIKLS